MSNKPLLDELDFKERASQKKPKNLNRCTHPTLGDMIRTASNMSQAVVKISGYCKGSEHALKHLQYISRKGKLELNCSDGGLITTKDEQKALIDSWAHDFGLRKNARDAVKIVLSAPQASNMDALKQAGSAFLDKQFGSSHEYVWVAHGDTKKPHLHVMVKLVSHLGVKLNPRKETLRSWRKNFAAHCRKEGIAVEASSRIERGFTDKSKATPITQMRQKGKRNIKKDHGFIKNLKENPEKSRSDNAKKFLNSVVSRYQSEANKLRKLATATKNSEQKMQHLRTADLLEKHANSIGNQPSFREEVLQKIEHSHSKSQDSDLEIER